MYSFKKNLLTVLFILICLCFVLVLPVAVVGSLGAEYSKVVLTAVMLTYYIFLAHCCALVLGKQGASGFGIAGLITVGLSVLAALYLMWGGINTGTLGAFAMMGGLGAIWEIVMSIVLVSFFSFAFAQGCLLLYLNPRTKVVLILRTAVLIVIGLIMLMAVLALSSFEGVMAHIISLLYVLNIFGTIAVLILHERSKHGPEAEYPPMFDEDDQSLEYPGAVQ